MKTNIEEKAKAYDEIIEKANKMHHENCEACQMCIEELIPELAESEDERIRKSLLGQYKGFKSTDFYDDGITFGDVVNWLEKQGEHKKFRDSIQVGDKVTRNEDGILVNLSQLKRIAKPNEMKLGEKPVDKVKPKFKVGDWIVFNGLTLYVNEVVQDYYRTISIDGIPISYDWDIDNAARLWSIQDAKDGDVLTCYSDIKGQPIEQTGIIKQYVGRHGGCSNSFKAHFGVDFNNNVVIEGYMGSSNIYPSTKEQRDLLFQKMKEAGYSFDFEKKELKKIEEPENYKRQVMSEMTDFVKDYITPKPTEWSEEDEKMIAALNEYVGHLDLIYEKITIGSDDICARDFREKVQEWLKSLKPQPKQEWSYNDEIIIETIIQEIEKISSEKFIDNAKDRCLDWLRYRIKSLKPQKHWKPTKAMMDALKWAKDEYHSDDPVTMNNLKFLYEELKKL